MGEALLLVATILLLAYANGANDNFKGVATLFGSRTTDYHRALWWATATTFAGSCAALALAHGLISSFSGKGLVPEPLIHEPSFGLAVGLGAALTVLLATRMGFPISTTHALTGALVGVGWTTAGAVNIALLGQRFVLPLLASPLLSLTLTSMVYLLLRRLRLRLGIGRDLCVCVEGGTPQPVAVQSDGSLVMRNSGAVLTLDERRACRERYAGELLGIDSQWLLDRLHFLSAGAVSFSRGVNDTPKIVALLVVVGAAGLSVAQALLGVGVAMALGGVLSARRVAETMSERITPMNHGQGLTANLITAALVIGASQAGLPVSTTHVSCGSLFGLGTVNRSARWGVIRNIVLSWLVTLPLAAGLAVLTYRLLG